MSLRDTLARIVEAEQLDAAPRRAFVELRTMRAISGFPEHVVDVLEGLLEHGAPDG